MALGKSSLTTGHWLIFCYAQMISSVDWFIGYRNWSTGGAGACIATIP